MGIGGSNASNYSNADQQTVTNFDESVVELILSEGRAGKETGVFDIVKDRSRTMSGGSELYSPLNSPARGGGGGGGGGADLDFDEDEILETDEEAGARKMIEELQRTFVYLEQSEQRR